MPATLHSSHISSHRIHAPRCGSSVNCMRKIDSGFFVEAFVIQPHALRTQRTRQLSIFTFYSLEHNNRHQRRRRRCESRVFCVQLEFNEPRYHRQQTASIRALSTHTALGDVPHIQAGALNGWMHEKFPLSTLLGVWLVVLKKTSGNFIKSFRHQFK